MRAGSGIATPTLHDQPLADVPGVTLPVDIPDAVIINANVDDTTIEVVNNQFQSKSQAEGLVLFFDALGSKTDPTFYYSETNYRWDEQNVNF